MQFKKLCHFLLLILSLACPWQFAEANSDSSKPIPPFRIAGNLYWVGNSYAANYLIVTPKGNILINSDSEKDVPMIKANIEKLGFKFKDTKILLISHAHSDHAGGSALIKKETGATYMVMAPDVPVIESGGKADFQYGNDLTQRYQPVKVDRVLHDGDQVKLGNTTLVAHLTAGHTKGCTTWTMKVSEKDIIYNVVIVGGPYVNPGFKLIQNSAYPKIAQDYEQQWQTLKSLPCDIFLGAHGSYFGLKEKYALIKKDAKIPFVDPEGYKKFVATSEKDFYIELSLQKFEAQNRRI